jgi:putative ABC transport system ATP-binding protein
MGSERYEMPVTYPPSSEPIVRMRGITKVFRAATGDTVVLKGIDVDVQQGEFVAVVGRSGSGKSTLVNMLTGIDRPTTGTVEVGGVRTDALAESPMALWRGRNLGIVFQFFQLLPMLTLVENVMLPMDFCSIYPAASRQERALGLLARVGLKEYAYALPGAVAGGQQQSAAIARGLANDPPILVADEPTGNLDSHTAATVMVLFEELVAAGKTILMVTHDRSLARLTGRTLVISDGELVNGAISAALPDLPDASLLGLSKSALRFQLTPGAPLPPASGRAGQVVYLVEGGELLPAGGGGRLGPGSLLDARARGRPAFAGAEGAVLLALPRAELVSYVSGTLAQAERPARTADGGSPRARGLRGPWLHDRWLPGRWLRRSGER